MKIKITSIETRTSATKGKYAYGQGTILKQDGTTRNVTIMSFGAQRESLKSSLRKGRTINVNAVFDGGVVKLLSPLVAKTAAAA